MRRRVGDGGGGVEPREESSESLSSIMLANLRFFCCERAGLMELRGEGEGLVGLVLAA